MAKMYLIECSDAKLRKVLETGNIYPQKVSGEGDVSTDFKMIGFRPLAWRGF
jgi:hypothetical protein